MNTGLRRGELFRLTWDDISLARPRHITVTADAGKTSRTRHIPINPIAHESLVKWGAQCGACKGLVFPGRNGDQLTNIKTAWSAVLCLAKISEFRFHDLRHHFASLLVMNGTDLNTVRELLGHSDIAMTLRYAHLADEHKEAAVNTLCSPRVTTRQTLSA